MVYNKLGSKQITALLTMLVDEIHSISVTTQRNLTQNQLERIRPTFCHAYVRNMLNTVLCFIVWSFVIVLKFFPYGKDFPPD